jgi:flavin-dependent dehydrogenase
VIQQWDCVIVGGGPAGASTASALARRGLRVLIVDRAYFPRDKPCAEYLSPEAGRVLQAMGALEACERAGGAELAGMIVRAPSGELIHGDFAAAHGWHGFRDRGLAIRRRVLDAILLDCACRAGAAVAQGERVTELLRDDGGAVCGVGTLDQSGRRVERRASFVVGADGLRSVVARRVGVAPRIRFPRRLAVVTHYQGVRGVGAYGEMHVEHDGYAGLADVGGGITNVAVVVPMRGMRDHAQPGALVDRWIERHPQLRSRFVGARRVSVPRATGPFAWRARRAWAPGVALVGDAADFFDPFTGEGIYAALRGGELLAPCIEQSLGATSLADRHQALAGYDAARRKAFAGKWHVEHLIGLAVGAPALMNLAALALRRRKDLADLLVGVTGDFVPPQAVLTPAFVLGLLSAWRPRYRSATSTSAHSLTSSLDP